jgi:hypothetical protein
MPVPTQAAIDAAAAEEPAELAIHDGQENMVKVHVGRRVRIKAAPGETRTLEIAFTGDTPFVDESPDPHRRRNTATFFKTSKRGSFPFNCFLDGERLTAAGYAGQVDVGPED